MHDSWHSYVPVIFQVQWPGALCPPPWQCRGLFLTPLRRVMLSVCTAVGVGWCSDIPGNFQQLWELLQSCVQGAQHSCGKQPSSAMWKELMCTMAARTSPKQPCVLLGSQMGLGRAFAEVNRGENWDSIFFFFFSKLFLL